MAAVGLQQSVRLVSKLESRFAVPAVVAAALIVRLAWAWLIPHNQAPDEPAHAQFVDFVVRNGRLPTYADASVTTTGYYAALSPLPYVPYIFVLLLTHTMSLLPVGPDLLLVRAASAIIGALIVWVAALNSRRLFPRDPALAIGIPAFLAFHPQLTFVTAVVNADTVSVLLASMLILWWTKLWLDGPSWTRTFVFAALVGTLMLSKPNTLALIPATLLVIGLVARKYRLSLGQVAARCAMSLIVVAGISAWFYVRNMVEFRGDWTGVSTMYRIAAERSPAWISPLHGATEILRYLRTSFIGWWAFFGNLEHLLPRAVYVALGILVLGSVAGIIRGAKRLASASMPRQLMGVYAFAVASIIGLNVVSAMEVQLPAGGRYWFPAILPTATLLFLGCAELGILTRKQWAVALVALAAGLNLWSYFGLLWPLYS